MRKAKVFFKNIFSGYLIEENKSKYSFLYDENYKGLPISLTLPIQSEPYKFKKFPPFFDGLLPEGIQLEGLLRLKKLDRNDYFGQLLSVGSDLVGAVTVEADS